MQLEQRFDPTRLYNAQTDQTDSYNLDTIGFFIAKFATKGLLKEQIKNGTPKVARKAFNIGEI